MFLWFDDTWLGLLVVFVLLWFLFHVILSAFQRDVANRNTRQLKSQWFLVSFLVKLDIIQHVSVGLLLFQEVPSYSLQNQNPEIVSTCRDKTQKLLSPNKTTRNQRHQLLPPLFGCLSTSGFDALLFFGRLGRVVLCLQRHFIALEATCGLQGKTRAIYKNPLGKEANSQKETGPHRWLVQPKLTFVEKQTWHIPENPRRILEPPQLCSSFISSTQAETPSSYDHPIDHQATTACRLP